MFRSRLFLTYFSVNLAEALMVWFLWWFNRTTFPERVPFNFLAGWGNDQLMMSADLWQLPALLTAGLLVATLISWYYWRREKLYSQFVIASMGFINFIALISLVRLIIRFT